MRPGFSLFYYRRDRARPNVPIHLGEKSYASRDSQGINNLLHPKMFLEDFTSNAGMTVPRVLKCTYKYVCAIHQYYISYGGRILIGKVSSWPYHNRRGGMTKEITNEEKDLHKWDDSKNLYARVKR